MSWDQWHVRGYGIACDEVELSALQNFVKNHRDSVPDLFKEDLDVFTKNTITDIKDNLDSGCIAELVSHVIREETGLGVFCPGIPEDGLYNDVLIYERCYPWEMNDADLKLQSRNDLMAILKPYSEELGGLPVGEFDLVYCG